MTVGTTKHSTLKTILLVAGVILVVLVKVFGPRLYYLYQMIGACPNYVSDPQKSAEGCAIIVKAGVEKSAEEKEKLDIAHVVIWLHLARVHTGQDDQKELEDNSPPYLGDKWPGPVLAFYLGKSTMDEMLAKAQDGDQKCEAIYYAGEAYLQKGMKDEAIKNFETASSSCPKDFVEKTNADAELAGLKR